MACCLASLPALAGEDAKPDLQRGRALLDQTLKTIEGATLTLKSLMGRIDGEGIIRKEIHGTDPQHSVGYRLRSALAELTEPKAP